MSSKTALFVASDVAKFCQVDLKTIHNWVEKGEIKSFRTPGRHLRFKPGPLKRFLEKFGYDVPADVASAAKADPSESAVAMIHDPKIAAVVAEVLTIDLASDLNQVEPMESTDHVAEIRRVLDGESDLRTTFLYVANLAFAGIARCDATEGAR